MHDDSYLAIARNVVNSFADDLLSTEAAITAVAAALASVAAAQRERDAAWIGENVMPVKKARVLAAFIRNQP